MQIEGTRTPYWPIGVLLFTYFSVKEEKESTTKEVRMKLGECHGSPVESFMKGQMVTPMKYY